MAAHTCAQGQPYPARPIRMIVGFAPGGGTDVTARVIASPLAERLGQRVVIDNRPGADGVLGSDIAAKSAPDGYTLLMVNSGHTVNPGVFKKLPYDTLRDFAPVTLVAMIANLLVVHPSLPAKSLAEFVRLARSRPGMINYASGGYGSSGHLAIELFKKYTHIELVHVPYKSGGLVATALLAGEVDVSFNTIPSLIAYVKAGRLRTLGVSTPQRSLSLPDVPTIAEQGYPGFSASGLAGLLAPAGTSADAIDKIQKEVAVLLKQPALVDRFVALGLEPVGNTPGEFDKFIRTDLEKWTQLTRELKINLQ
ncbi:MAG TPA: tripartite tricarboxylate transporter substrate binding protein [Burkholderiales bacterium]|nr:tripartite tricarboxylate transporter substrate binding protein [Burkholderiales bacterium]